LPGKPNNSISPLSQEIPALSNGTDPEHIIDTQGNGTYNAADAR
jgi:hypothetical protein